MRKKILFVINQFYKGGAESSLLNLLHLLDKDGGYDSSLVVYNQQRRKDSISLFDQLPAAVSVCVGGSTVPSSNVLSFVSRIEYDLVISVGEWHSPKLVMECSRAKRKAIWLHADITSATIPKASDLFDYNRQTDAWLCVSDCQCRILREKAPFIKGTIQTLHNAMNLDAIIGKASEAVESPAQCKKRKRILMIGNLRPAKNYLRAVEVAAELKRMGSDAVWMVCGNLADREYVQKVRSAISHKGLTRDFLLLGSSDNPWKYLSKSDVLVSTSDTESWCMAVSEALALGVPVVSTSTDGVSEQIRDGVNGYLCGFDAKLMARRILQILRGSLSRSKMKSSTFDVVSEVSALLRLPKRKEDTARVVVVIDDVNYRGGAHAATARMLKRLYDHGCNCDIFSGIKPTLKTRTLFAPIEIKYSQLDWMTRLYYEIGAKEFLRLPGMPLLLKVKKLILSMRRRLSKNYEAKLIDQINDGSVSNELRKYDSVVVMSEASRFRKLVSELPKSIRKVQLIHTFYTLWRDFSFWTREITAGDAQLYGRMDCIALIGRRNVVEFNKLFPSLAPKVCAFHNIIECSRREPIKHKARGLRLITVARLEPEKDIPRMIRVATSLKRKNIEFIWNLYGDGSLMGETKKLIAQSNLTGTFRIHGFSNHAADHMRESDLFVLLSHYEGLPNVIYESLCVGTPVFSTDVGGIPEQIADGRTGKLVSDDEPAIVNELEKVLRNPEEIIKWKNNLKNYKYDNDAALREFAGIVYPSWST